MCGEQAKHQLLSMSHHLKDVKKKLSRKCMYINKDLTPLQREEDRKMYEELRDMRAPG